MILKWYYNDNKTISQRHLNDGIKEVYQLSIDTLTMVTRSLNDDETVKELIFVGVASTSCR